jgi:hypothetical protein
MYCNVSLYFVELFGSVPVGHNTLGNTVEKLCKDADIEGNFTNHSLRATTATRGLEKGIPEKFVMQRTGLRDVRSLQKYQLPVISTKISISRAFDGGVYKGEVEKSDVNVELGEPSGKRTRDNHECECEEKGAWKDNKFKVWSYKDKIPVAFNNCKFVVSGDISF